MFESFTAGREDLAYPYWSVDLGMSIYVDHLYITNVNRRNGEW